MGSVVELRAAVRVLVVDDHAVFAEALARAIAAEDDLEVVGVASDGDAAVRALKDRPDVVLLDHNLPGGDGVSVARKIAQACPQASVVMLTAVATDRVVLAAVEAGCAGYITKDRPLDDVLAAVRAAAAGESSMSPAVLARLLPRLRPDLGGIPALTPREQEVLDQVATGRANKEIAEALGVSVNTVRNHVQNLLNKVGVHSKVELVSRAARAGLVTLHDDELGG